MPDVQKKHHGSSADHKKKLKLDQQFSMTPIKYRSQENSGNLPLLFVLLSLQGERGDHGPPGKGERGELGPIGPKVSILSACVHTRTAQIM